MSLSVGLELLWSNTSKNGTDGAQDGPIEIMYIVVYMSIKEGSTHQ